METVSIIALATLIVYFTIGLAFAVFIKSEDLRDSIPGRGWVDPLFFLEITILWLPALAVIYLVNTFDDE